MIVAYLILIEFYQELGILLLEADNHQSHRLSAETSGLRGVNVTTCSRNTRNMH
jgi:hypothetical protein